MTIGPEPACTGCAREFPMSSPAACEAFPGGIPDEIYLASFLHTRPYPGDNGLTFKPEEGWTLEADGSVTTDYGWHYTLEQPSGVPGPGYVDHV